MNFELPKGCVVARLRPTQPSTARRCGSPLTKNIVQLIAWEWLFIWLTVFLPMAMMLDNGFCCAQRRVQVCMDEMVEALLIGCDSLVRARATLVESTSIPRHALQWSGVSIAQTI